MTDGGDLEEGWDGLERVAHSQDGSGSANAQRLLRPLLTRRPRFGHEMSTLRGVFPPLLS
jgi:hypothetical protein